MKLVQCENGHLFDIQTMSSCPTCGAGQKIAGKKNAPQKKGLFHFGGKNRNQVESAAPAPVSGDSGEEKTAAYIAPVEDSGEEKTVAYIASSEDNSEEKTVAYIASAEDNCEERTVAFIASAGHEGNAAGNEKTVMGWLVAVQGPHRGESFEIIPNRNFIGRADSNQIALAKDKGISREKQACVFYEPKKKEYWLQVGLSDSLTYLNGEVLMNPVVLKAYDRIGLGQSTELLFIPLCGENFTWEE